MSENDAKVVNEKSEIETVNPEAEEQRLQKQSESIVDMPFLSVLDADREEHNLLEDDDEEGNAFSYTGAFPNGKLTFIMHGAREYRIPNRFHKYYGYILENDATEIFKVSRPKEEIIEPDGTIHYLLNADSALEYVGGDHYAYEMTFLLDHRSNPSRVRSITISATHHGYVHYADTLFQHWADSATVEDTDKEVVLARKKAMFKELR